jgi:Domain of unknown function (DUF5666)
MTESNDPRIPGDETEPVAFHERVTSSDRHSTAMRAGVLAGSALLVVVGIAAAMGASPSPATGADPSATTASPAPDASGKPKRDGGWRDLGKFRDLGRFGFGGGIGSIGFGEITISAIDGSNVSLETADGWTRTISVTSDTAITKGGQTIAKGDLAVGDQVRFSQIKASDGSYDVKAIVVVLPRVAGRITAIDGNTVTVTQLGGTTATIHVDGDTVYTVNGTSGKLSDLKVDSVIVAEGTQRANGSLDAASVRGGTFDREHLPGFRGGPKGPDASPVPSTDAG